MHFFFLIVCSVSEREAADFRRGAGCTRASARRRVQKLVRSSRATGADPDTCADRRFDVSPNFIATSPSKDDFNFDHVRARPPPRGRVLARRQNGDVNKKIRGRPATRNENNTQISKTCGASSATGRSVRGKKALAFSRDARPFSKFSKSDVTQFGRRGRTTSHRINRGNLNIVKVFRRRCASMYRNERADDRKNVQRSRFER